MKTAVVGGDKRFDRLAELLAESHRVFRNPEDLSGMDWVIAKGNVSVPPGVGLITLGGGGCGIDMLQDEAFSRENAHLTAEGAVCAAMQAAEGAIFGSCCLVVGYGRIGQALTGILLGMGAHVIAAARREAAREAAQSAGAEVCGMPELSGAAARADYIFSTPPAMVLTEAVLRHVREGVPVIDLASPPYGVDLRAAQALGVRAWRESGVPGRYCPDAAAKCMLKFVRKAMGD